MHRRSPESEGHISSLIALFCLMEQALSGYGVRKLLKAWRIEEHMAVSPATIYRSLERLEKQGMLKSGMTRNGRYPSSRVYRITPTGRKHYRALVGEASQFQRASHALCAFLALGAYLPVKERIRLAEEWQVSAQAQVEALSGRIEDHRPGKTYGKPYSEWLVLDHERATLRSDVLWLEHYIGLLKKGQA